MTEVASAEVERVLDPETLVQSAVELGGVGEFRDMSFYDGFCKLVEGLVRETDFHERGLEGMRYDLIRNLVNRLRLADDLARHPEILDEDVADPIIIIGLPRSGTTKLQRMLSAPESVQKMYLWRALNPGRFPNVADGEPGAPDPRIAGAGLTDFLADEENKAERDAIHRMHPLEVEEDGPLYMLTFDDWIWSIRAYVPSYFEWVMDRPSEPAYAYVKTVLQSLQWQDGGARGRPWVVKSITYLADLETMVNIYPNATYVTPHRDPRACVPSFTKWIASMRAPLANPVHPHTAGTEMLGMYKLAMARYLEARDRLGLDERIIDVSYEQVRTDPMSIMEQVYERAGRTMSAEARQSMRHWHEENEQGRFGAHEYSLREYGIDEAMIDGAFADYIDRFIER